MYCLFYHLRWIKYKGRVSYRYSSCAEDFIHFCACTGECLLKNEEQHLGENCDYPAFKLKALVIDNKSDLTGDI